ncbi:hypothetical protein [Marinimicrococcus flavescens]|uniref:Uncharacterized protein n=1 Tax=Marinimicrococcus flavescens TaxID=3031815 RepID=A0AAP4D519_9PROT|nr:hypothetical protein [Marinimicrococcus flavescens]
MRNGRYGAEEWEGQIRRGDGRLVIQAPLGGALLVEGRQGMHVYFGVRAVL